MFLEIYTIVDSRIIYKTLKFREIHVKKKFIKLNLQIFYLCLRF